MNNGSVDQANRSAASCGFKFVQELP